MITIPPPLTWEECFELTLRVEAAASDSPDAETVTIAKTDALNLCERLRTLLAYDALDHFSKKREGEKG